MDSFALTVGWGWTWRKPQAWIRLGAALFAAASALLAYAAPSTTPPPANTCVSCHRVDPLFSHPVDFAPTRPLPASLPLKDGLLTCTTCHETPSWQHAQQGAVSPKLRGTSDGAALCAQCHTSATASRSRMHGASRAKAHLMWPNRRKTTGAAASGLDQETRNCLTCHDGTIAKDVSIMAAGPSGLHRGNHPVGIAYRQRSEHLGDGLGLVPSLALDQRIRLFDNTVGCGSCHSPYSSQAKLLVVPNERNRLCVSCHQP